MKKMLPKASAFLTGEGHAGKMRDDQALARLINPNLVSALIQRGALR